MIVRQYAPCSLGRSIICLGKQGEINALRVEFDVSAWMAMYPDATVKLMHFAPDRPQDNPVIPTLGVEGTLRVWIVGEEDTAGAGNGVIELLLIDERTGSTIKSATGYTTVLRSPSAGIESQEAEAGYVRYDVDQSAMLTDEQKAVARKNIGAGTGDGTGSGGIMKETDPTVPDWAKKPKKPTYTASEVGALPSSYTPPVTSVNGKTGAVALSAKDVGARPDTWTPSASDVGADAAGTASGAVAAHNVSGAAHADLRALIEGLNSRLNALADSDDTTLDQLSEIVAYIKSNKALIDAVTTGKVSVSDIVDNLTTNASGKVLSAAQGVALKAMIDGIIIPTALPNPQPITINGQRYDGSEAVTVTVSSEGGGTPVEIDGTLTQSGKAADAKAVGDRLSALNEANATQDNRLTALEESGGVTDEQVQTAVNNYLTENPVSGALTANEKELLLTLFKSAEYTSNVKAAVAQLEAIWTGGSTITYNVTNNLSHITTDNKASTTAGGMAYTATLTADEGYTISEVTITMNGEDVTADVYADGVINIASVLGDIVIMATAAEKVSLEPAYALAEPLVFDGTTMKEIDSGFTLYDASGEDTDVTICADYENNTIYSTVVGIGDDEGLGKIPFMIYTDSYYNEVYWARKTWSNIRFSNKTDRKRIVLTHAKDSVDAMVYGKLAGGTLMQENLSGDSRDLPITKYNKNFIFGSFYTNNSVYATGTIHDFRVYKRILSDDEINEYMEGI